MFKRLKNIQPANLAAHVLVTLAYPAFRGLTAQKNGLLLFTDAMTIIALVLVVCGVVYALVLRGDLDVSGFVVSRGLRGGGEKSYRAYKADRKEEREEAFNYPLFLGIVYLAAAWLIAGLWY